MSQYVKEDAEQAALLLSNTFFQKHIWQAMHKIIDENMLLCNTGKEPERAADLVRYRQLLNEFESVAKKAISKVKAVEKKELKLVKKKTAVQKSFSRF